MTWFITGNSNATTTSFLGTTNLQPLVIKTNNKEAMRVASADGDVSIGDLGGTRDPDYKLDVQGILNADDIRKGGTQLVGSQWKDVTGVGINYGGGNVGIGTTNPTTAMSGGRALHVDNPTGGSALRLGDGAANGQQWEWQSTVINGVGAMNLSKLTSPAANPLTVLASGNVGIGTLPGHKLHVHTTGGAENQEVRGVHSSLAGTGLGFKFGMSSDVTGDGAKWGGLFTAVTDEGSESTFGMQATATGGGTGLVNGVNALAMGTGTGTKLGVNSYVDGGGEKIAGRFSAFSAGAESTSGLQVQASGSGVGLKTGVQGSVSGGGSKRAGVFTAESTGPDETFGIFCSAYGNGTGTKYALFATQGGGGTRYAGYFNGNVLVTGTLSKGGGGFLIDHPEDPYNKTLRHNFVESPENLCLYRGKVELDADGKATVRMPDYFAPLTKEDEATVYLTPIGEESFPTSYRWEEEHTSLTVFGSARAEVAYLVLADRDDPAIRLLSRPVEQEKGEGNFEKGKLLNPEAFDEPEEMGIAPQLSQAKVILEEPAQPGPLILEVPDEIGPGGLGAQGEPLGPKVGVEQPRRRRSRSSK